MFHTVWKRNCSGKGEKSRRGKETGCKGRKGDQNGKKDFQEEKEPKTYISKDNAQITDRGEIDSIITTILQNNPNQIEQYKNGKTNLFDYFVGQVMKETRGKANPVLTKEILKDKLDN